MNIEDFMMILVASSIATSLLTEVIKSCAKEFPRNLIALLIGVISGIICAFIYAKMRNLQWNCDLYQSMGLMATMSGIGAMVGYDKIKQTLKQIWSSLGGE